MESKVLEKIKKLLALSESKNEHESRLALERANEILLRHNLTMQDVNRNDSEYGEKIICDEYWTDKEQKYVLNILHINFFVEPIEIIKTVFGEKGKKIKRRIIIFIGTKENILIAEYMYHFLIHEFRNLWIIYKIESKCNEKSRESYYIGLFNGILDQLRKRKQAVEKETSLVVVKDKNLEKYIKNKYTSLRTRSSKIAISDDRARAEGFEKGKIINIRNGIEENNSGKVINISGHKS